jgi:hypothetical protein
LNAQIHTQKSVTIVLQEVIGYTVVIISVDFIVDISSLHLYQPSTILIKFRVNHISQFGSFVMRSALAVFGGTRVGGEFTVPFRSIRHTHL